MTTYTIHIKAPGCWMNDQGRMHWGHAVSEDLVHWEHTGIALFSSKRGGRDGCFSGSSVEHDGKLYLYYTGVHYLSEDPEDTNLCLDDQFVSAQMMITSEDGIHVDNIKNKREIIAPIEERVRGDAAHTRDPKVLRGVDAWYMVLGTHGSNENGRLLFYRSADLEN